MTSPQSHQLHIEPAPLPPPVRGQPVDDEKKDTHHTHDAVVAPASTAYDRDRDYADPEVRFESESTHRGEFGTKRDLVSVWVATPRRVDTVRV